MDQVTSGVMPDAACARQAFLVKGAVLFLKKDERKHTKKIIILIVFSGIISNSLWLLDNSTSTLHRT
jgi:hypothetical protein